MKMLFSNQQQKKAITTGQDELQQIMANKKLYKYQNILKTQKQHICLLT